MSARPMCVPARSWERLVMVRGDDREGEVALLLAPQQDALRTWLAVHEVALGASVTAADLLPFVPPMPGASRAERDALHEVVAARAASFLRALALWHAAGCPDEVPA